MNVETLRFILCALLMLLGLIFEISAVVGVFRFRYVLNRMHAAAMGDTMGILMMLLGLAVSNGLSMLSLKLMLLVLLFWLTSPVSSHLIGRLELVTNEGLDREVSLWKR